MTGHYRWRLQAIANGWHLPKPPFLYRIPIIKRIRYAWDILQLDRWYSTAPGVRTGYDEWCLHGWWHGLDTEEATNADR